MKEDKAVKSETTNCRNLERIVIPRGIKEIGALAFSLHKNLMEVVIPDSVNIIGL